MHDVGGMDSGFRRNDGGGGEFMATAGVLAPMTVGEGDTNLLLANYTIYRRLRHMAGNPIYRRLRHMARNRTEELQDALRRLLKQVVMRQHARLAQ